MKIDINYGLIILMSLIIVITIFALGDRQVPNSFSAGQLFGTLMMLGLIMIRHGITYDTKTKKWSDY